MQLRCMTSVVLHAAEAAIRRGEAKLPAKMGDVVARAHRGLGVQQPTHTLHEMSDDFADTFCRNVKRLRQSEQES